MYVFSSFLLYLEKSRNHFPKFKYSQFYLFYFTYIILKEYYLKNTDI